MNETITSTRYGLATFTGTTLSPGDSIQLSFDLWFVTYPPRSWRSVIPL